MSKAHMMSDLIAETHRVNSLNFDLKKVPATVIVRDYFAHSQDERSKHLQSIRSLSGRIGNMTQEISRLRKALVLSGVLIVIGWGVAIGLILGVTL